MASIQTSLASSLIIGCLAASGCNTSSPWSSETSVTHADDAGLQDSKWDNGDDRSRDARNVDKLDLLLVVDNSGSMAEEQASLIEGLAWMLAGLTSGDLDHDGTADIPPIDDIHLGVVSTDMGAGGYATSCPLINDGLGDDGILQNASPGETGCPLSGEPNFLSYSPEGAPRSPLHLYRELTCVAQLGTSGCGFEQPLEAMLKALVPSDSGIEFLAHTVGHGDQANAGFLREDSLLAVILLTDEDDCSAQDPTIFDGSDANPYPGGPNTRCGLNWEQDLGALWPIERYVDGLVALRPDSPHLVMFAAIVGVPTDLVADANDAHFGVILRDSRMSIAEVETLHGTLLRPSCSDSEGVPLASPPPRIVETAEAFEAAGATSVVQSICETDLTPALDAILAKIANVL